MYATATSEEELRTLGVTLAERVSGAELVPDYERVMPLMFRTDIYDQKERWRRSGSGVTGAGVVHDIIGLVLSTATAVTVEAVVDAAREWLRSALPRPRGERSVLIYGPDGEPLRKVRLRRDADEPETFEPPWPLPEP